MSTQLSLAAGLVPAPNSLEAGDGELVLDERVAVAVGSATAEGARRLLRESLAVATGFAFGDGGEDASIRFEPAETSVSHPGGYALEVDERAVVIRANDQAGYASGVQTLRQLLPAEAFALGPVRRSWAVPAARISDAPRFAWRGVMLDVSRHYLPSAWLFRFVDLVAAHKINVVHLHLNDDQGWRFPSEAFPRLVEVGSWRRETRVGHELDPDVARHGFDGTPHGGFYSRSELKALVAFAAARNVRLVPEIDLPGHAEAAIASYPELGHVGPIPVGTRWGISRHTLNVSDATLEFCRQIWDEVGEVFPSPFVHIGGDECPRDEWRESPVAAERIVSSRLSGVDEIQSWFTGQLAEHLGRHGRRIVGWDEILEGGVTPKEATVMSWRGEAGGLEAARSGNSVVMSPEVPCYLDHYQSEDAAEPLAIGGCNSLENVFSYEPAQDVLDATERARIRGIQANLWTEYVPDALAAEYMLFPRLCAFAERAWSERDGAFGDFRVRLTRHLARLDACAVNYRPLDGPRPQQQGGEGPRRRFDRGRA
jgi:hexosaminidase